MNDEIVYENINEFYKKFNIDQTKPINNIVEYMQQKDDILVLKIPNNLGLSGMIMNKKDRNKEYKCIYINTNEPIGRQDFTFVHELYHVYFEKAPREVCLNKERNTNPIEKRAEIFASNILIPRVPLLMKLRDYMCKNKKSLSINTVFKLQRYFNVSFQSIIYAIDNLSKDKRYTDEIFRQYIPEIGRDLRKYYTQWEELELITKKNDPGNNLNSVSKSYEFPTEFRKNIIRNYKNKLVSYEEASILFDFFNENFNENLDI